MIRRRRRVWSGIALAVIQRESSLELARPPPPSRRDAAGGMQACIDTRPTCMTVLSDTSAEECCTLRICGISDE